MHGHDRHMLSNMQKIVSVLTLIGTPSVGGPNRNVINIAHAGVQIKLCDYLLKQDCCLCPVTPPISPSTCLLNQASFPNPHKSNLAEVFAQVVVAVKNSQSTFIFQDDLFLCGIQKLYSVCRKQTGSLGCFFFKTCNMNECLHFSANMCTCVDLSWFLLNYFIKMDSRIPPEALMSE